MVGVWITRGKRGWLRKRTFPPGFSKTWLGAGVSFKAGKGLVEKCSTSFGVSRIYQRVGVQFAVGKRGLVEKKTQRTLFFFSKNLIGQAFGSIGYEGSAEKRETAAESVLAPDTKRKHKIKTLEKEKNIKNKKKAQKKTHTKKTDKKIDKKTPRLLSMKVYAKAHNSR